MGRLRDRAQSPDRPSELRRGGNVLGAKAGRPLVKVTALDAPAEPRRLGFLAGEIAVPDDFDRMGAAEIDALFGAGA